MNSPSGRSAPRFPAVMIVDDHAQFRCAVRHWIAELYTDMELIEAASAQEAIALAGSREIDIVLMDIELPGMNGLEAAGRIRETRPEVAVIIVSQHAEDAYRERASKAGACAYITKDKVFQELLPAIGCALHDETLLAEVSKERR